MSVYQLRHKVLCLNKDGITGQSGRPEEFHLQPPSEPCVNLSIHTAPVSHSLETSRLQADA
ncbi:MAG: hypothetical protein OEM90_12455, partial [Desulfobacteraceae bacterium]|nr:hypothetical protein [Desulfobacteraceae bacterium]